MCIFFYEFTTQEKQTAVVKYPCNQTRIVPIFASFTMYVVLLAQTKSLQLAMEKMKGEIMEELRS